jgi:CheY-like chemotaxis protein
MPRRSGFEVLDWVRQHGGEMQRVPVVVLSTSEHLRDIKHAYELDANGFVVKPLMHDELKNSLDKICAFWLD